MNTFTTQLNNQQNLQSFLLKNIQYLSKYFKTVTLQSQQKTYSSINKICSKIQSKFINQFSIQSLAKKLCLNVQTKINNVNIYFYLKKQEDIENNIKDSFNNKKKIIQGMKSFIINIQSTIDSQILENCCSQGLEPEPLEAPTRCPSTESEYSWIRKTVLEELDLLKDDIQDADDRIDTFIQQCLGKNIGGERFILIFESFLNNQSIYEKIIKLGWIPIIVRNQKNRRGARKQPAQGAKKAPKSQQKASIKEINISQISSYLHKCHSVLISSDSITKTGGFVTYSGGLMLSLMAKKRKIPLIVVSRNYCLSDKVVLSQKGLSSTTNPGEFYQIQHDDFSTYITKDYDYLDSKYIDLVITERGCWMVQDISLVQDQYWSY